MHAADWIALIGLGLGGGGGGAAISKLTRLAVAVEQLVKSTETVTGITRDHETRLSQVEGQLKAKAP